MALWFETALVGGEWRESVRIMHRDGQITGLESAPPAPDDERGAIAVPGLPNLHSHAFQRGMAGLAETRGEGNGGRGGDSFWTWREVMYRFVERIGPDDLEAIAALAFMEMLEAGFTRVGEFHYLHHAPDGRTYDDPGEMSSRIAAAAAATGLGLTLLPVFYAHGGFGGAPAGSAQRRFVTDPDSYARLHERAVAAVAGLEGAVVGVAPHSLRAATPGEIALIAPLAWNGPVHIHVAEQTREVDDCLAVHGARPVEWLIDQVGIDARWCLIHATHVTAAETAAIAAAKAVVGLCPITEANLGDGLFPAGDFLAAGGRFGIGSDSNVLIEAAEELRTLEYGERLRDRSRNVLASKGRPSTGARLFAGALSGGAQALGVAAPALSVGEPLDLVSLSAHHPSLAGRWGDAWLDSWIFAGRRGCIDGVWRHGQKVVADGRHRARAVIEERYNLTLRRILTA